ncbi:unnamed protein product, partial [Polarella glacialis]
HNCSGVGTFSTCEATCGNGYGYASGAAAETFTCTATGEFQGTAPACEPSPCATLGLDSSDGYSHDCSGNVNSDSCIVACADGFSAPNGTSAAAILECGTSGYTGSMPTCEPTPCSSVSLPTGLDLEVNCTGLTTGESCMVSCAQGYSGAAANFTCTSLGDFSGQRPICTPQTCDDLVQGLLEGVTHDCSGVRFGSKCGTSCAAGHSLAANSALTELHCLWDAAVGQVTLQGASPVCEPDPCVDNFPSGESFQHDCAGVTTTGVCTVQCAPGYDGSSPQNLSCAASGVLEGDTPNCTARTCAARHLPGMQQGICQDLSFGDSCFTTCEDGYDASSGVQQWTCDLLPGGGGSVELQGSDPDCQPLPCLDNSPVSAQFQDNCAGVTTGSSCDVVCTSDYVGSPSNLTCGADRAFYGSLPVCQPRSDFPVPEVEDANVSNMSNATLIQEEEFVLNLTDFVLNLTDTIEVRGLLSLNVTDAEAFMNDPEALAALKDGLAAAIKVNPAYLTVTVSLTPFTVGNANSRRLASESSALYISYTVIMKKSEAAGLEANPPSATAFEAAISAAIVSKGGSLASKYSVVVMSATVFSISVVDDGNQFSGGGGGAVPDPWSCPPPPPAADAADIGMDGPAVWGAGIDP